MAASERRSAGRSRDEREIEPNEGREIARRAARQWLDEAALIPVAHLHLDVDVPIGGWPAYFATKGIEVVEDDVGRLAVRRSVLAGLLRERREREERLRAERAEKEKLVAAPVPAGIPALEGGTPMESLLANDPGYQSVAEEFGRGSVFTDLLDRQLAEGT